MEPWALAASVALPELLLFVVRKLRRRAMCERAPCRADGLARGAIGARRVSGALGAFRARSVVGAVDAAPSRWPPQLLPQLLLLLVLVLVLLNRACIAGGVLRASRWSCRCARCASSSRDAWSSQDASRPLGVCSARCVIRTRSRARQAARPVHCSREGARATSPRATAVVGKSHSAKLRLLRLVLVALADDATKVEDCAGRRVGLDAYAGCVVAAEWQSESGPRLMGSQVSTPGS
jgi:hypothetical protein